MPRLIVHVGPGKCGSSSVQRFFGQHRQPCEQSLSYRLLRPAEIAPLERADPQALAEWGARLHKELAAAEVLVLSHEQLFQSLRALRQLCELGLTGGAQRVDVIGYCRRQSDYIGSAYGQWLFRDPQRMAEVDTMLQTADVQPALFSGLERQLIAALLSNFHSARQLSGRLLLNWNRSYLQLQQQLHGLPVRVHAAALPARAGPRSLIEDFCERVELRLLDAFRESGREVVNTSFDPVLIEAVQLAAGRGMAVPGPHHANRLLVRLSALLQSATPAHTPFLQALRACIDGCFAADNRAFCARHDIDPAYFAVDPAAPDLAAMLRRVGEEAQRRLADPLPRLQALERQLAALAVVAISAARESADADPGAAD